MAAKVNVAAAATLAAILTTGATALAQTAKDDSVTGRPHPDFDPLGIELDEILNRVGILDKKTVEEKRSPLASFVVHPVTELEFRTQSNVFRTQDNPKSDQIAYLRPSLSIGSDWNRHAVNLTVGGDIARHQHYDGEDFENARVALGGALNVSEALTVNLDTKFSKVQEQRGTPEDLGPQAPPVQAYTLGFSGGMLYKADLLLLNLKGKFNHLTYKDGDPATTFLRDYDDSLVSLRTGWEFTPGTTIFVEPSYNSRVYQHRFDSLGFLQGSEGYRILNGVSWDVSGVTFLEAGVGWMRQTYKEPTFAPSEGPSFLIKAIWNPDQLVTITVNGERRVDETTAIDPLTGRAQKTSGLLVTEGGVVVDYEFLENLIISGRFNYSNQKFEGSSRTDNLYTGGVLFDYKIGHKWYAQLGMDNIYRKSNLAGVPFEDQIFSIRFGEHL